MTQGILYIQVVLLWLIKLLRQTLCSSNIIGILYYLIQVVKNLLDSLFRKWSFLILLKNLVFKQINVEYSPIAPDATPLPIFISPVLSGFIVYYSNYWFTLRVDLYFKIELKYLLEIRNRKKWTPDCKYCTWKSFFRVGEIT